MSQIQVQAQLDKNQFFNRWLPVLIKVDGNLVFIDRLRNGLLLCYPRKIYAVPASLRFIIHPEMLESPPDSKYGIIDLPDEFIAVTKLEKVENVRLTKYGLTTNVLNITLLPPKRPSKPKYKMLVISLYGKSTGKGASISYDINIKPVWETLNSSNGGNHWITWYVFIIPPSQRIAARRYYVSNRGNISEYIIDLWTGEKIDRYEVLEAIKSWPFGKIVKMRDNLKNEEFLAAILEYHQAWKTSAETKHEIQCSKKELLYSTYHEDKTHWKAVYRIVPPCKILTTRISNSGKKHTYKVEV